MNIGKKTLIGIVIISIIFFVTVFVKADYKVAVTLENWSSIFLGRDGTVYK